MFLSYSIVSPLWVLFKHVRNLIFCWCFTIGSFLHAQWPTSTLTDSALSISYGFYANVLTFDDGSSIFSHGILNSVYLTKLDEGGYRVWPQFVVAHQNDSTDTEGGADMVSDGAGGGIVKWEDHRGATRDPLTGEYWNNALYIQRVDSNGVIRWGAGEVREVSPQTGKKGGRHVTDGAGGTILAWVEWGFGYPGAPNRANLKAARFNANGQRQWETTLDSMFLPDRMWFWGMTRAGRYVYIQYYRYDHPVNPTYLTHIIDTSGVPTSESPWVGYSENVTWRDSVLFSRTGDAVTGNQIVKISSDGDTLFNSYIPPSTGTGCKFLSAQYSILPSVDGGVYYLRSCGDSLYHLNGDGQVVRRHFTNISEMAGFVFGDERGGLVLATVNGFAQRYDSLGTPLWSATPVVD